MYYFSYNDFMDCTENGRIKEITRVAENITKYEQKNGHYEVQKYGKQIIQILKEKTELTKFLNEFLNFQGTQNIIYYNSKKEDIIISKIKEKEIFIFIKVIENIDNSVSYKMFENSMKIIKEWNKLEKKQNKRYPIVIPIVIYIGNQTWNKQNFKRNNKINYITYENNRINFSYNIIKIEDLRVNDLKNMKSKVAEDLLKIKNKYLQIN